MADDKAVEFTGEFTGEFTVEFTVEPFVDGEPPPYVIAAVDAVAALGLEVEVGPFGSTFSAPEALVGRAVGALVDAAYSAGATHVAISAGRRGGA